MSVGKRLLFSLVTVVLILVAAEGGARFVWWRLSVRAFYLANLDRIVLAFRRENPAVLICISTLVGRWPLDSAEDFVTSHGRT